MPYKNQSDRRASEARYRKRREESDPEGHKARVLKKSRQKAAALTAEQKAANAVYLRAYREMNADRLRAHDAAYSKTDTVRQRVRARSARPDVRAKNAASNAKWRQANSDRIREKNRKWREENRDQIRSTINQKYRTSTQFKLSLLLRGRLNLAFKNKAKTGSAVKLLGCSIVDAIAEIEGKFQPGMTWENWGLHTWHIDHIRPLATFDLTNPAQLAIACHISNLQPLWATENLRKGGRKLADRGGRLIEVPAAYTSQTCAECGVVDAASRQSQSRFVCTSCNHEANADTNAAIIILKRGLDKSLKPAEGNRKRPVEAGSIRRVA